MCYDVFTPDSLSDMPDLTLILGTSKTRFCPHCSPVSIERHYSVPALKAAWCSQKISVYHAIFTSKSAPIWTFFFFFKADAVMNTNCTHSQWRQKLDVCVFVWKRVPSLFFAIILHRFIELTKVIAPFGKHYQNKVRTQRQANSLAISS